MALTIPGYSATVLGQKGRNDVEKIKESKARRKYLPDFVKMAEAQGASGVRIEKKKDVVPMMTEAFKIDGPVVIECICKEDENVYPMVPPGAALEDMVLSMV